MSDPSSTSAAFRPRPLLVHTFVLATGWLLLMRVFLGVHSGVWPMSPLAVLSDLAGAAMLTLLLLLCRSWLRPVLVLVLAMAFYAAAEHLAAHGTLFRLPHLVNALNPTFVRSASVFGWGLVAFPAYCALAWLLHRLQSRIAARQPAGRPGDLRLGLAGVVLVAGYTLAVPSLTAPANNVVATALAQAPYTLIRFQAPAEPEEVERIDRDMAAMFFQQRLGRPRVATPPDILMIMVEGMSAAYLPGIADYHGLREPAVALPGLERGLEQRGFRLYRNVLAMQRKTDRGSYSMLCGGYPRLDSVPSKMAAIAEGEEPPPDCLPAILGRSGYYTSYQQAANLEYMGKDRFMPRIGFDESLGGRDLAGTEEVEGWGLMDPRFFALAGDRIRALDRERDRPWFATLLNVGTHHPFPEPGEDESVAGDLMVFEAEAPELPVEERHRDRQAAFSTMSGELLALLDRLERDEVLADTLVIITSDESGGFIRGDRDPGPLDGNAGFMAVRPPAGFDRQQLRPRDDLVAHIDVALTAVDAAGIGVAEGGGDRLLGHSLLAPATGRERGILLGNTYAAQSLFLLSSGRLMSCAETLLVCDAWTFEPGRLFGTLAPREDAGFLDLATRRRLAEHAALIGRDAPAE